MSSNWENLPQHLLQLFARCLPVDDFVAFSLVCSSWRSAAVAELTTSTVKPPWLMLTVPRISGLHTFFSLSLHTICEVPCWYGREKAACETGTILSSRGWILSLCQSYPDIMWNPLLRTVANRNVGSSKWAVKLPDIRKLPDFEPQLSPSQMIHRFVLSASQTSNRNYLAMIIYGANRRLAFWSPSHKEWTAVNRPIYGDNYCDVIYYKGQLVALNFSRMIITFDVDRPNRATEVPYRLELPSVEWPWCCHLVESMGSLLLVEAYPRYRNGTFRFHVHAIDLEARKITRIKSLGQATIFLDNNSSFSMRINEKSYDSDKIEPNCIYYVYHDDSCDKSMGIYRMEDAAVEPSVEKCPNPPRLWIESSL